MTCWKLVLEYDGTRYSGWQEQRNARTVAGELRAAAAKILGPEVELDGAGRTDAGVHALAQVARLRTRRGYPAHKLLRDLNAGLPKDIVVLQAMETDHKFHPRHDAVLRYYLYQISLRRTAFSKPFVWWVREPLDLLRMQQAAGMVVGRHDFERFSDKRAEDKSTLVVVHSAELEQRGDLVLFRIGASHFLWKMVRRIVGILVEVGRKELPLEDFECLLSSRPLPARLKSYSVAAHTAPASGLFLEKVLYEEEVLGISSTLPMNRAYF